MNATSRRKFLALSGLSGAAALSFPAFMRQSLAQDIAAPPKRFMTIFMPNAVIRDRWVSSGGRNADNGTGDATQFTYNQQLESLAAIRQHMTLVHGTNMAGVRGDLHSSAQIRVTTGEDVREPNEGGGGKNFPGGPSLDTLAAEESPLIDGASTPFKQLVMNCDTRGPSLHHQCTSADMASEFIAPENQPVNVYNRLFQDVNPNLSGEEQAAALERHRARRGSVLDFLAQDIARLEARVPALEKQKLQSHLDGIRGLERALEAQTAAGPVNVTLPTGLDALRPNNSGNHPEIIAGFLDITRAAFQLDLTRVASFSFGTGNNAVSFADFGAGPSGGVHNISHQSQNDGTRDRLTEILLWYTARVADFVQSLAAIPEGTGTMLDNTLIMFYCEVGQWHEHRNVPVALIGGKNFGHVGGRVLVYDDREINDVGMSIIQALQIPRTTFGDERWFRGAAPELIG